jgi:nucleoside-diphosphate-sugar epimerase
MSLDRVFLVTGASGFVGRELCRQLVGRGWVRALFRRDADGPWDETVAVDLSGEDPLDRAVEGVDTVYHLAAKTDDTRTAPRDTDVFRRINLEGTKKLFDAAAAAGVGRFVYMSSIKAMGTGGGTKLDEDSPARPVTPYGLSKKAAEDHVLAGGIDHVSILRATPVYGAGSKGNLSRMIRAVSRGVFPPVPEVTNARSMVHVEDLARAVILAGEKNEANGKVYLVSDGLEYSTRQMYEWICTALGRSVPSWALPLPVLGAMARVGDAIGAVTRRPFVFNSLALDRLLGSARYDSRRIQNELAFRPEWNLERALPDMVAGVLKH